MTGPSRSIIVLAGAGLALGMSGPAVHGKPLPVCPKGAKVVYDLDAGNVTGWRHNITAPIPEESAHFEEGSLVLETGGRALRYDTSGGGSGIRIRVGRTDALPEDDPRGTINYVFYDLPPGSSEIGPDHFLMIDGDIFWPRCREAFKATAD